MGCPVPLCRWSGTACVSSGLNFDWVRVTPLQKTHRSKTEKETSPWTLAAYSAGAFCVGLACATAIMRFGTRKTALSQFTQERLVQTTFSPIFLQTYSISDLNEKQSDKREKSTK